MSGGQWKQGGWTGGQYKSGGGQYQGEWQANMQDGKWQFNAAGVQPDTAGSQPKSAGNTGGGTQVRPTFKFPPPGGPPHNKAPPPENNFWSGSSMFPKFKGPPPEVPLTLEVLGRKFVVFFSFLHLSQVPPTPPSPPPVQNGDPGSVFRWCMYVLIVFFSFRYCRTPA